MPESKFELIAELGRGGMATVYLARAKKRPDKLLVLKQLRAELAEHPEFLAMFLEEARLAGKLQHPNIVETYEVGQDAGVYYIAMEYLEGLSLQAVLTKFGWKGEFSFPLQVFVLIEALKALEQAYTQRDDDGTLLKIVHRDVSPPNIIITFDGQVKLVDFGIAKAANSHVETRTGLIKGKLTYMAPEQAQSGDVDSRTDIYSVGVMLWQAAAGTRRWKGIENTEVLKRLHEGDVVESPNAKKNNLPAIVDDIVVKAIDPDPEKRHRSASAFRGTLESLLREMNAEVGAQDLGTFMTKHFGDARERAATVMKQRLLDLNANDKTGAPEAKESVTAIRAAASEAGQEKPRASRTARTGDEVQVGGAAAALAEKIKRAQPVPVPATSSRAERRAPKRRNHAVAIAILGLGCAAGIFAYAHHFRESPPMPASMPSPSAAAIPAPTVPAGGSDTNAATAPNAIESATVATPAPSSSSESTPAHVAHHHRGAPTPAPAPPAVHTRPTPEPTTAPIVTAVATVPPAPTSAAPDPNAPALDKQDPWKASAPRTDKADPWAGQSPSTRQDPWGH